MKKIVTTLLLSAALAMTFVSSEAFAKRMGSGGDSGMQRSVAPAPAPASKVPASPATAPAATAASTAAAGATSKSSWMGPLMGLAAGGLLAAAFMGGAFDGISPMDIVLLLLIAGGVFFFLRRRATANQAATAGGNPQHYVPPSQDLNHASSGMGSINIGSRVGSLTESVSTPSTDAPHTPSLNAPSWFNEAEFTAQAKQWFVQLQAAWDKKDYALLGAITTPELLTELRTQREAQADNNTTKVDEVFVQVVEFNQDQNQLVLTVRFNGYLSEQEGAFPHAFSEYWHLLRMGEAQGEWKLAGIQQDK